MGSQHTFHIPVMGLAYTIDSPIKVARFGINSVISIIQDTLIEKMRSHYYHQIDEPYQPIGSGEDDYRARRITDYLNLVHRIVSQQIQKMKNSAFEQGSEISKYFELLPDKHQMKIVYNRLKLVNNRLERLQLENRLREYINPGSIDVNIMTKLDKNNNTKQGQIIENGSDAVSALRGYIRSNLTNSSVVLSAGMNPRLFAYMEKQIEFEADQDGIFQKKIVIKVSDYRSALIQGKMLAKKGLWVSEFRIESGLNCGGHAFATDGFLLGPILEEFKRKKAELINTLHTIYNQALQGKKKPALKSAHPIKISVQGGIGTSEEDSFLRHNYGIDSTGWGTPFLLVPEATTVDENTLKLLSGAKESDIELSKKSPLGVRFHYLKGTTAEKERLTRIEKGKPGSPCTEKFLVSNTEFSAEPVCTASRVYQKKKLEQLKSLALPETEYNRQANEIMEKECLCVGLSNAAVKQYNTKPFKGLNGINICPGPNIAYFSEIVTLQKMTDHIYGRTDILRIKERPHMFLKELSIYIEYWMEFLAETKENIDAKRKTYIESFHNNLMAGINYYKHLSYYASDEWGSLKGKFHQGLECAEKQLDEAINRFRGTVMNPA